MLIPLTPSPHPPHPTPNKPTHQAIAVGRLAQAATAHGTEATGAIALDARFQRLVQALLADGGRVLSAMPPQQLAGVVEVRGGLLVVGWGGSVWFGVCGFWLCVCGFWLCG